MEITKAKPMYVGVEEVCVDLGVSGPRIKYNPAKDVPHFCKWGLEQRRYNELC